MIDALAGPVSVLSSSATGPSARRLAGQLGRAVDRRRRWPIDVVVVRRLVGRRAADAPAVELALGAAIAVADRQLEHVDALEKERALLGEVELVRGQVDLLGIGFDLAEIGIDRRRQRERRSQAVLQIEADVAYRRHVLRQRAVEIDRLDVDAAGDVRQQLEATRGRQVADAAERSKLADDLRRGARPRRPRRLLLRARDVAHDLQAPVVEVVRREFRQLVERDPETRRSSRACRIEASPCRHTASHVRIEAGVVERDHKASRCQRRRR